MPEWEGAIWGKERGRAAVSWPFK